MNDSKHETATHTAVTKDKQWGEMGRWAHYYDPLMTLMTLGREKKLRQMSVELCQLMPGNKVLEIGCGTGTLSLAAKVQVGPSGEVAGIDLAPEMVAVARRKAARQGATISFQEGSIANIPFSDERFDVVVCSFMIFHMPDDVREKGIAEIRRVLKPGGHWCIVDAAALDELAPVLREASFSVREVKQTKFLWMRIWFLRANAEMVQ